MTRLSDKSGGLWRSLMLVAGLLIWVGWVLPAVAADDDPIGAIRVEGIRLIEEETVKSYLQLEVGEQFDPEQVRASLKGLYDTGFFKDVVIERDGSTLVVRVEENPMVSDVTFEGNDSFTNEDLEKLIQAKPRTVYSRSQVERDLAVLRQAYRVKGLFLAEIEMLQKPLDSNRINLVYRIKEGDKSKVRVVRIVGNQSIADKKLTRVLMIKPSNWLSWFTDDDTYDRDKMLYDQEQLRSAYLDEGYARVRVDSSVAELTPDRRAFVITHTIHEGDRYRFGKIAIESDVTEIPEAKLYAKLRMVEGEWFTRSQLRASVEGVEGVVGDLGYAFLDIVPASDIDDKEHVVNVTLKLAKGERVYVNRINITGNTRTRDEVIRRELRFAEGDRFATSSLKRSKERLNKLQFFEKVEITSPRNADDRVDVEIKVEEKPTGTFSIGAGYSTTESFMTAASLSQNNFLGRGQKVMVAFALSGVTREFDISLTDPYFQGKDFSAGFDIYNRESDQSDYSSYEQSTYGTAVRLGFPLSEYLRNSVTYSLAHIEMDYTDDDDDDEDGDASDDTTTDSDGDDEENDIALTIQEQIDASPYLQSMISNTLSWDNTDSYLMPTSGRRHKFTSDLSGLGGDIRFLRFISDNSYYRTIWKEYEMVMHLRGKIGVMEGLGEEVPVFERFFLGGSSSLRGFEYRGVGPRTTDDDAYGGTVLEQGNAEVMVPVPGLEERGVYGLSFVDVGVLGDFRDLPSDVVASGDPRVAVGLGVLWNSPFGPMRAHLGFPVMKEEHDKDKIFDFTFGTSW